MQETIKNRTIFCRDNLDILYGIDTESIDLIYLDPPFNKKKKFNAPTGSSAEGASFSDIFREADVKEEWVETIKEDNVSLYELLDFARKAEGRASYNFCYLAYMAIRLIEMYRVLKDTGSIYLHCDPTMSHYLKLAMDCVFGEKNFRNEIVWKRTSAHNDPQQFGRNRDSILFYAKTSKYFFKPVKVDYDQSYIDNFFRHKDDRGRYQTENMTGPGVNPNDPEYKGYSPASRGRSWSIPRRVIKKLTNNKDLTTLEKLKLMEDNDYIVFSKNGTPRFKSYLDDLGGAPVQETWTDINPVTSHAKERTGYPTQKPLTLLERIILASSNENDIVLDPFCGCATTCVASEALNRQWIGIDISVKAYELVKERLKGEVEHKDAMPLFYEESVHFETRPPVRTDQGIDWQEKKWVYVISHIKFPGEYKVGIAKDWKLRLSSYQTGAPDQGFKMEHKKLTPKFRETEKYIHEKFENKREWVTGSLKDIIYEIEHYGES